MGSSAETRNFGFRRFTNIVREGRLKTAAGSSLRLGTAVEQNLTTPTEVQECADNSTGAASPDTHNNLVGILWYEHDAQTMEGRAAGSLNVDEDIAPAGRLVQVIRGPGVKVWLRNTDLDTTEPGLNYPASRAAVTMVNGLGSAGVSVGDLLGWDDANSWYAVTTTTAEAILRVESVDDSAKILEAVLLV